MTAADNEITTVALLQRRDGMTPELFSAYWRDVHGVLAARIPGFRSYVQNHVEPCGLPTLSTEHDHRSILIDGFAEVTYDSEADRQGLATSDITPLILRDERNVFSHTLLYNLEPGASCTLVGDGVPTQMEPAASYVLVLQSPLESGAGAIVEALEPTLLTPLRDSAGLTALRRHLLMSGDPTLWNTSDGVDNTEAGPRNSVVLQASWRDVDSASAAIGQLVAREQGVFCNLQAYRVTARYEMVLAGRPTHLGLRGLDALRTIEAAGADNQKDKGLIRRLYGASALGEATALADD